MEWHVYLFTSLPTLICFISLLVICVCRDKSSKNQAVKNLNSDKAVQQISTTSLENEITVEMREHCQNDSRPKSNDNRALPDIPIYSDGSMPHTTDDDEELNDGLYDVIAKAAKEHERNKKAKHMTPVHAYEKVKELPVPSSSNVPKTAVKETDLTSVNTIDNITKLAQKQPAEQLNNSLSVSIADHYATTDSAGSVEYATVNSTHSGVNKRDVQKSARTAHSICSVDTNASYSFLPPIPDKHLEMSPLSVHVSESSHSPVLPPRNSASDNDETVRISLNSAQTAQLSDTLTGSADTHPPLLSVNVSGVVYTVDNETLSTAVSSLDTVDSRGRREPPYSRVTARESLSNLRERNPHLGMNANVMSGASHVAVYTAISEHSDSMYESVDYDRIKMSSGNDLSTRVAGERNSFMSDLYAEIPPGSGENSSRSSMYARVGDIDDHGAPVPPPIELLKSIDSTDVAEPGYSSITGERSLPNGLQIQPGSSDTTPVFSQGHRRDPTRSVSHLYAQVKKKPDPDKAATQGTKLTRRVSSPARASSLSFTSPTSSVYPNPAGSHGTGARPKTSVGAWSGINNSTLVRDANSNKISQHQTTRQQQQPQQRRGSRVDPGYQTIDSVNTASVYGAAGTRAQSLRQAHERGGFTGAANTERSASRPGIAREIKPSQCGTDARPREHIYHEISQRSVHRS